MMLRSTVLVSLLAACWGADVPPPDAGIDAAPVRPCDLPPMGEGVSTLAGCKEPGTLDGSRGEVRFNNPTNVVIGGSGVVYVTDFDSSRIRAIDARGTTKTVYVAPDFQRPFGLALAPLGKLYVETDDNDRNEHSLETGTIWLVDPNARTATVIARDLGRPRGLAVLPDGRIAMSDYMHHVVSILDPATGLVTPLAGKRDELGYANGAGDVARFAQPYDIVLAADGSLLVADLLNHRIRKVTLAGEVTDFAGSGERGALNGPAGVATFDGPQSLALSASGALYVGDVQRKLIRKIEGGMVSTIAGDGTPGYIDATEPRNARFYGVEGIDVDGTRLVIADGNVGDGREFHRVRVLQLP